MTGDRLADAFREALHIRPLSKESQRELTDYITNLRTMGRYDEAAVRRFAEDLARRDAGLIRGENSPREPEE